MAVGRWVEGVAERVRGLPARGADAGLALAVAVPVSVPFLGAGPGEVTWLGLVLNAGTVVPLVWRRRAPFAVPVAVAVFATLVALHHRPGQHLQYGGLLAVYTVADLGKPWQRQAFLWWILLTFPPASLLLKDNDAVEFTFTLLLPLTAYLLGSLARANRARAERERTTEAARAAAAERARIARDMHDVLAHAVSLMVVQAEAGPVAVRTDPERAERAFDAIADTGRDAMAQLRRMLGVLKDDDGQAASRAPGPSLAALPALVAGAERARLRVALRELGEPRPLTADAEAAAYRIVQEALTNTVRHAAATAATVTLDWRREELLLTVADDGRGPARTGRTDGRGLVGIRERARACGGRAETGPGPGGGFEVAAHLPYRSAVEAR
ncbi:histidine kinase [Streptomyces capparidis]